MWKPIPDTNYEATERGEIRHRKFKRVLKHFAGTHGYPVVRIGNCNTSVHRLVLLAFRGYPPDRCWARHLDGSRTNCCLSNLVWDTARNNANDKKKHGTEIYGERNGNVKLIEKQIKEIRRLYIRGKHGCGCPALAKRYKVCLRTIQLIVSGKTWRHI